MNILTGKLNLIISPGEGSIWSIKLNCLFWLERETDIFKFLIIDADEKSIWSIKLNRLFWLVRETDIFKF